ncbi:MAG: Coenzyme F420 hydrogenase/dehydrogenase, beta subunit C-terminal domain [Bacteroidales bacterium]|nr:Coenzyme F420 hydrogenase/dehydrogenase, beta subunit C-terminal domain [Bacteroidales bacterium]
MDLLRRITDNDLCLGCGICLAALGGDNCRLELHENGYYRPQGLPRTREAAKTLRAVCPGISLRGDGRQRPLWGQTREIAVGWSTDAALREKASSGGLVSALAIYLVEQGLCDAVLQVGPGNGHPLYNELKVSRNREEIIANAQSRYAPAPVFPHLKTLLDQNDDTYAFVGKPCDVAALQNFLRLQPSYQPRIKAFLAIFCAGIPSYQASRQAYGQAATKSPLSSLRYRGNGWPGLFQARFEDGSELTMSYEDSWGKILGRQLGTRCKICPDGIGLLADIAVGDAWLLKDGKPDFQADVPGRSLALVRTGRGSRWMAQALDLQYIEKQSIDPSDLPLIQPYQCRRRRLSGWRALPLQCRTGFLLRFKGINLLHHSLSAGLLKGLREAVGSWKRMRKAQEK